MKYLIHHGNIPKLALIVYSIMLSLSVGFHELWADELQSWAIATGSTNLSSLFVNTRYEGHPLGWFLLLFFLSKISTSIYTVHLVNISVSILAMAVFITYSPFSNRIKTLFLFGYFPLFEYGVKSRPYMLGVLLIFIFSALQKYTKSGLRYFIVNLGVLFVLAQTSAMGFIAATWLGFYFFVLNPRQTDNQKNTPAKNILKYIFFISAISASLLYVIPPEDSIVTRPEISVKVIMFCANSFSFGFYSFSYSLIIMAVCTWLLHSRRAKLLYILTALSYYLFYVFVYGGAVWHKGHLFILLIAYLWLDGYSYKNTGTDRLKSILLTVILLGQLIIGLFAYYLDYRHPYSNAKNIAQYIKNHNMGTLPVMGDPDYAMTPVAVYLGKPIYYPKSNRYGTFVISDKNARLLGPELFREAISEKRGEGGTFLVITSYELGGSYESNLVSKFTDFAMLDYFVIEKDRYYLYSF